MSRQSCKSCAHFTGTRLWDGRPSGTCHRHAPRPWVGHLEHVKADRGSMGILVVQPIWPQVFTTDRCGEHTPNKTIKQVSTPSVPVPARPRPGSRSPRQNSAVASGSPPHSA